ncbi:MAG: SixA phosphatase family protein [Candidatus Dormibacteria bacterium]
MRHARASNREQWPGPDWERPLTSRGQRQSDALVDILGGHAVSRVLSSPYVRCAQTVAPLAALWGLPVEETVDLAEGAGVDGVQRCIDAAGDPGVVLCTHGDVLAAYIDHLARAGVRLHGEMGWEKASTWMIDVEDGAVTGALYLPPPGELLQA